MTKPVLTGLEVEARGLLKFACDSCRDLFPARCDAHRVLVLIKVEEEPEPPSLKLLLERWVSDRKVLGYGGPIPGYTAPYEHLEADIADTLKAQRG